MATEPGVFVEPTTAAVSAALYDHACRATTHSEAMSALATLVAQRLSRSPGERADVAEAFERQAVAYWAGYFTRRVRLRVERLYEAVHPVLGDANKTHSFAELVRMGMAAAEADPNAAFRWPRRDPPYPDEP